MLKWQALFISVSISWFHTLQKFGVSSGLQLGLLPLRKWRMLGRAQHPCLQKLKPHWTKKSPQDILTDSSVTLQLKSPAKPTLVRRQVNCALYCYSGELQQDEKKLTASFSCCQHVVGSCIWVQCNCQLCCGDARFSPLWTEPCEKWKGAAVKNKSKRAVHKVRHLINNHFSRHVISDFSGPNHSMYHSGMSTQVGGKALGRLFAQQVPKWASLPQCIPFTRTAF